MATQKSKNEGARQMVTFSQGLNDLATAWAEAEGRTLGSVLTYALELGLRSALKTGEIPPAAISKYNLFCEQRRKEAEDERERLALKRERIGQRRPQSEDELAEMLEIDYWGAEQGIEWDDVVDNNDPFYQAREECRQRARELWPQYQKALYQQYTFPGRLTELLGEKILEEQIFRQKNNANKLPDDDG